MREHEELRQVYARGLVRRHAEDLMRLAALGVGWS